jgi:hypothetical protein
MGFYKKQQISIAVEKEYRFCTAYFLLKTTLSKFPIMYSFSKNNIMENFDNVIFCAACESNETVFLAASVPGFGGMRSANSAGQAIFETIRAHFLAQFFRLLPPTGPVHMRATCSFAHLQAFSAPFILDDLVWDNNIIKNFDNVVMS